MKKWLLATLALAFTHAYAADSLLERINAHGTVFADDTDVSDV